MEAYLSSLSKRQTMLLLTTVTFGGPEGAEALEHLPDSESELLRERAAGILGIAKEQRVPLLVQEMRRLMAPRQGLLAAASADQVAEILKKERPALRRTLLKALPRTLSEAVRKELGEDAPAAQRDVRPEILAIVRGKLEEVVGEAAASRGGFKFADVLVLASRELLTLSDVLGARALGPSIAGLSAEERTAFLSVLPPDQRPLATLAAELAVNRGLGPDDARVMFDLHGGMGQPSACLRSAGIHRLARACLAQSPEFGQRVVARHPGEFGAKLSEWLRHERTKQVNRGDGGRTGVVDELNRLAAQGLIEKPIRLPPPKLLKEQAIDRDAEPRAGQLRMASLKPGPRGSPLIPPRLPKGRGPRGKG
ncbi:MAG: hypothetical protein ACKVPX_17785 [Myxococcaceae bacterium]